MALQGGGAKAPDDKMFSSRYSGNGDLDEGDVESGTSWNQAERGIPFLAHSSYLRTCSALLDLLDSMFIDWHTPFRPLVPP